MNSLLTRDRLLLVPYITRTFPAVAKELKAWRRAAAEIPERELSRQALASIDKKRFHCQGGSVYTLYNSSRSNIILPFIVALQTISDYLDNLSDRVGESAEAGLVSLHGAMMAGVDPAWLLADWYQYYHYSNDGGYLGQLVDTCRKSLQQIPHYNTVVSFTSRLAALYSDLQVFKHIDKSCREQRLKLWFNRYQVLAPDVKWWEFSAACGSTLGIFALTALAAEGPVSENEAERLLDCYFPWLCGLHILLDYFIDLDEDRRHGDLNFVSYYPSQNDVQTGMLKFLEEAQLRAGRLPRPLFHLTVIKGLLAMYLSDPKALQPARIETAQLLLRRGGAETERMHRICLALRSMKMLYLTLPAKSLVGQAEKNSPLRAGGEPGKIKLGPSKQQAGFVAHIIINTC